jgi:hypothetical protein
MTRRLQELKRELARRLGPLLPDIPAEQFEELIDVAANLQHSRELRSRQHTDPLVSSEARRDGKWPK